MTLFAGAALKLASFYEFVELAPTAPMGPALYRRLSKPYGSKLTSPSPSKPEASDSPSNGFAAARQTTSINGHTRRMASADGYTAPATARQRRAVGRCFNPHLGPPAARWSAFFSTSPAAVLRGNKTFCCPEGLLPFGNKGHLQFGRDACPASLRSQVRARALLALALDAVHRRQIPKAAIDRACTSLQRP